LSVTHKQRPSGNQLRQSRETRPLGEDSVGTQTEAALIKHFKTTNKPKPDLFESAASSRRAEEKGAGRVFEFACLKVLENKVWVFFWFKI
jgi:hypothetical protein